ncbi:metallophosphoesterase family protein [Halorussus caseinilyticus]|uniref:Metallophosphoesterase family protein n=1 Tax=Halorussus caseinilyticus TaxID=3034025 RepID=A0ABD5WTL0_9EURY
MTTEGSAVYRRRDATTTADDAETPEIRARRGPATLARFARPRADTRTTLAVVSDPHLSTDKEGTWKVFHRTEDRLRAAIADANDRGVDGVVFAGDLTEDGRPEDFDGAADVLADLDAPFVAVPGNHDVPKAFDDHDTPPVAEFADRFAPGEFPFRTQFGGVDVLGLNSASAPGGELDATHDGAISDDQLSWLESTLPETDAALVVSHHNLPGLDAAVGADGYAPHPPVGDAPAFVDALRATTPSTSRVTFTCPPQSPATFGDSSAPRSRRSRRPTPSRRSVPRGLPSGWCPWPTPRASRRPTTSPGPTPTGAGTSPRWSKTSFRTCRWWTSDEPVVRAYESARPRRERAADAHAVGGTSGRTGAHERCAGGPARDGPRSSLTRLSVAGR